MSIKEQLLSALMQVAVVLGLALLIYGILWMFFRPRLAGQSLRQYLGLVAARNQLDKTFWFIWLSMIIFAVISLLFEFHFSLAFRDLLTSENSPYGKILSAGLSPTTILKALIYCFVQASLAEELLFRGLIGKRLFNAFGNTVGNIAQSLIFWLMHLMIFKLITGQWISSIQLITLVTSFGIGLVLGYANFRRNGESIAPSWILHGTVNFFSFLALATVWP